MSWVPAGMLWLLSVLPGSAASEACQCIPDIPSSASHPVETESVIPMPNPSLLNPLIL